MLRARAFLNEGLIFLVFIQNVEPAVSTFLLKFSFLFCFFLKLNKCARTLYFLNDTGTFNQTVVENSFINTGTLFQSLRGDP